MSRALGQQTNPDSTTKADLVAAASAVDTIADTPLAKVNHPTVVDVDIGKVGVADTDKPTDEPTVPHSQNDNSWIRPTTGTQRTQRPP